MHIDRSVISAATLLALIAPIHAHALHKPRQAANVYDCDILDDIDGGNDDPQLPGLSYPATCTTENSGMIETSVKAAPNAPLTAAGGAAQPAPAPTGVPTGVPSNVPAANNGVYDCDDIDDDENDDRVVYPATCTTENNGMLYTSVRNALGSPLTSIAAAAPSATGSSAPAPSSPVAGQIYDCDQVDDDFDDDGIADDQDDADDITKRQDNDDNDDNNDDNDDNNDNNNNGDNLPDINPASVSYPLTCTTVRQGNTLTYVRTASNVAFASVTPGATNSGSAPAPTGAAPTSTTGDDASNSNNNNNNNNGGSSDPAQPTFTGAAAPMATAGFRELAFGGAAVAVGAFAFGL